MGTPCQLSERLRDLPREPGREADGERENHRARAHKAPHHPMKRRLEERGRHPHGDSPTGQEGASPCPEDLRAVQGGTEPGARRPHGVGAQVGRRFAAQKALVLARAGYDPIVSVDDRGRPVRQCQCSERTRELRGIECDVERVSHGAVHENRRIDQHQLQPGRRSDVQIGHDGLPGFEHPAIRRPQHRVGRHGERSTEGQTGVHELLARAVAQRDERAPRAQERPGLCVESRQAPAGLKSRRRREHFQCRREAIDLPVYSGGYTLRKL